MNPHEGRLLAEFQAYANAILLRSHQGGQRSDFLKGVSTLFIEASGADAVGIWVLTGGRMVVVAGVGWRAPRLQLRAIRRPRHRLEWAGGV